MTGRERLQLVSEITRRQATSPTPGVRFDMWLWDCGAAACSIGHACQDERIRNEGLKLSREKCPNFDGYSSFRSLTSFFDIGWNQVVNLFCPDKYWSHKDPILVADRIDAFLASHKWPGEQENAS